MWEPLGPRMSLTYSMSEPFPLMGKRGFILVKESAIMSMLYFNPKSQISSSSFSVTVGISIKQPGKHMFFFSPSFASFKTLTFTVS